MFHAKGLHLDASGLLTDKAGKRQYERNNIYVRPSKKALPNGSHGYYVSLRALLKTLYQHPETSSHLQEKFVISEDGFLRDLCDGLRFRRHAMLNNQDSGLGVLLYCEDVEIANPLGMKRGMCGKLTLFYVIFANFPPPSRSQLNWY